MLLLSASLRAVWRTVWPARRSVLPVPALLAAAHHLERRM
jgi:hypothetical protein